MSKKTHTVKFAAALDGVALPSGITAEDLQNAEVVELVAFPVLPASPFTTQEHDARHGLNFTYNAEQLIAAVAGRKRRIPLTIEHNDVKQSGDTRARGWIHRLFTSETEPEYGGEPGVLYAWVELNDLGKQEHDGKLYGYTSAVGAGYWLDENTLNITGLRSLTLTNDPATAMPMAFTAEQETDEGEDEDAPAASATQENHEEESPMLKAILAAIGVADDADEATVLSAIEALKTPAVNEAEAALTAVGFSVADVATLVRASELEATKAEVVALTAAKDEALATVQTLTAKLQDTERAELDRKVTEAVDAAVLARKITPAQRDAMLSLARADLTAFCSAMDVATSVMSDGAVQTPTTEDISLTADEVAFCKAYGFKEASYLAAKKQRLTQPQ